MPDDIREDVADVFVTGLDDLVRGAEVAGHALLVIALVKGGVGEGDGKRIELLANETLGQRGNNGGVEPAAEIGADGDVRKETEARRVRKEVAEFVEIVGVGGSPLSPVPGARGRITGTGVVERRSGGG